MILRNQAECPRCGELVASIHRHDYRSCSCGGIAVDGGISYLRRTFEDGIRPIDRSIHIEDDLPLWPDAAHCLTALVALSQITNPESASSAVPLSMVNNAVANYVWAVRGKPGLPADIKVSAHETRKWLELLARNGHVERKQRSRRGRVTWRSLVRLASHPDVP